MPTRSCVVCRKRDNKCNLLRIVSDDDKVIIDKHQKINKRAIYFCKDKYCIEKAVNMIKKGKFKLKIGINLKSLEVLLNEVRYELGE